MDTKFAIGCFVQWYEIEMINEYILSLKSAIAAYPNVTVHFTLNINQNLEKLDTNSTSMDSIIHRFKEYIQDIPNLQYNINEEFITIADYRRSFLQNFNNSADVLVFGESDALLPKKMFIILDMLHSRVKNETPKYLATFGINKMWDESWKKLEHVEFTNKPFIHDDDKNWWSIRYNMAYEEMENFNDSIENLEIININPHKFNGCGLILSSEAVRSGVNIPYGTFFIDDTALQAITNKLLPNMPQYHFKNILIVHNRKHPKKRMHIKDESTSDYIDDRRKSTNWYNIANEFCKINDANIFNPHHKFYTWEDVWKAIK